MTRDMPLKEVQELIDALTPREREVLQLLMQGCDTAEVAEELNISRHTVNTHRRSILYRTGFKNTQKLALTIISYGSQIQWH
jgi:DNA-binding CsgD family transcriptional regulator